MKSTDKPALFLSVIQTHKGILYKIANAYCKDMEDRKDLVQEIIAQLWKSFDNYNDQYKYSTWIYRIALNVAISFYRKENRRKEVDNPLSEGVLHMTDTGTPDENDENIRFLQQFITELKELDKALLLLYLEEKSHKEIAEIMGISVSNVATKINRIKAVLKQKFTHLQIKQHGRHSNDSALENL
jgi:RNA polymerase sigma factor (sigma-70 family)